MKYYLAPMEGITGYIYRNAYHKYFHPMDKYFTPFLVPNHCKTFKSRELNEILPDHNTGLNIIPQIMSNQAADFLFTVKKLQDFGYREVNLNLGCPSKTVVSKGRGSGFLAQPQALDRFFDDVFCQTDIRISVKTRIGKEDPDEFSELIKIYNKYPIEELIIHPRIQTDFYKNKPNLMVFGEALSQIKHPVCYNGDLFTPLQYQLITKQFPQLEMVMMGRGVLMNPGLIDDFGDKNNLDKQRVRQFHDQLYAEYQQVLSGERNVLFKMKEFWFYLIHLFDDAAKAAKKIKKSQWLNEYEAIVEALFAEKELMQNRNEISLIF